MKKRLFSIVYMFVITFFFTFVVSAVKFLNEERIETNQRVKMQRIILHVLGISVPRDAGDKKLVRIFETRVRKIEEQDGVLYVGYEKDGETVKGYAFPVEGPGFWGPIYGMAAINAKATKILGVAFYRHSETPGLGGRITEKWFQDQFAGLDLQEKGENEKLFRFKPMGTQKERNELDAITGATQTSRAVEAFLNSELERIVRELRQSKGKGPQKDA